MAVNPKLTRRILVIHGVLIGKDEDQKQHIEVRRNVKNRLGDIPLKFRTEMYHYENINDRAQRKFRTLVKLLIANPVGSIVTDKVLDLVGDVVIARLNTSTAHKIREGLKKRILEIYEAGNPCYVLAHSLGSIYAFDVINELVRTNGLFDRGSRRTWPVQGLVTIGSPIGLSMFKVAGRRRVADLGEGTKWLRWVNYWDRTDPIVSGDIFGKKLRGYRIAEQFQTDSPKQGWVIRDRAVDTGKGWLLAHVGYWDHPVVGDGLVDMITN